VHFICPDNKKISIQDCLKTSGCRLNNRCASLRTLQLVGHDRKWRLSPSCAGNGPRYEYLKATVDYAITPESMMFAILGTGAHAKLHQFDDNVLSEQPLKDKEMTGTSDALQIDEYNPGKYILVDEKTWGSFKVAKALGIVKEEETVLDKDGKPVLLKSGKRIGQPKTHKVYRIDPTKIDMRETELQLNRYRIFWEQLGYPISKMLIEAIVRDGGTASAYARKIDKRLYLIPVKRLNNDEVLGYYRKLNDEVVEAFRTGYARKCNNWESWDGKRCTSFCDVKDACVEMSKKKGERWGIL
jgi:hypothetical protein